MRYAVLILMAIIFISCKNGNITTAKQQLAAAGFVLKDTLKELELSMGVGDGGKKTTHIIAVSQEDCKRIAENIKSRSCYNTSYLNVAEVMEVNTLHGSGKKENACRVNNGYFYERKTPDGYRYKIYIDTIEQKLYYTRISYIL